LQPMFMNSDAMPPKEEAEDVDLHAVFKCPNPERVVCFRQRPLGISFEPGVVPLKVAAVEGRAAALGLKPGSVMKAIASKDVVSSGRTFDSILAEVRKSTLALPATRGSSLEVVFNNAGESKVIMFTKKPLGLNFCTDMPLKVITAVGHAAELGVEVDWTVERIGKTSVESMQHREALETLIAAASKLQQAAVERSLPVVFEADGRKRLVVFKEKPLGLCLARQEIPLRVTGAIGHAAELGIVPGWVVLSVAGRDVTDPSMSFGEVVAQFKRQSNPLPEARRVPKVELTLLPPMDTRRIVFTRRPTGLSFGPGLPLEVSSATSHAAKLGCQPGWVLQSTGDEDLEADGIDEAQALKNWQQAEAVLPHGHPPMPELP